MECPWSVPWREEQVDSRSMNPSKQRPGAVQVADAWPVTKTETLRMARQDARSASDGTSAGGEAHLLTIHRCLMEAGGPC